MTEARKTVRSVGKGGRSEWQTDVLIYENKIICNFITPFKNSVLGSVVKNT